MKKEFNLSKREIHLHEEGYFAKEGIKLVHGEVVYKREDVKEFIKRLKETAEIDFKFDGKKVVRDNLIIKLKDLNKLAGENLTKWKQKQKPWNY